MCGWAGYGMGWGMGLGMLAMWLVVPLVVGAIWIWSRNVRGDRASREAATQVLREPDARGDIGDEMPRRMDTRLADRESRSVHDRQHQDFSTRAPRNDPRT